MEAVSRNPEELLTCPYDPSHRIMACRMNTHLHKCKRAHPNVKLVECDFNVDHKIPEPELQYHHETCPDRRKIEIAIYQEEGTVVNKYPIPNVHLDSDENWDNEPEVKSYDPNAYCVQKQIYIPLDTAPAAQRKNFRMEERRRFQELSSSVTESQAGTSATKPDFKKVPGIMRKELPETQTTKSTITEKTPASVTKILERIKVGANKPVIPKEK